ncbi:MAG: hypothetical protein FVQ79_00720 [Planctomycetes bacterium]|nr:hypothetical protein [Planctomycetota bacterium]
MFQLQKHDEPMKWPVKVYIPRPGGTNTKATFMAHFMLKTQDEADVLSQGSDQDFMEAVLVGWDAAKDEEGNELPFSEEARQKMVNIPYVKTALVAAYFECIVGGPRKN